MTEVVDHEATHPIDWRWDDRLSSYIKFQESENYQKIKDKLSSNIELPNTEKIRLYLDYFNISYKIHEGKNILIETSRFLTYLIWKNIWIISNSNELWVKRAKEFSDLYFGNNDLFTNHLIYYMVRAMSLNEVNVYVIDNKTIRVCDRGQYKRAKTLWCEKHWSLQIEFNSLLSYCFTGQIDNFEYKENEYNLSDWEAKVIEEIRLDKYSKKEIKIDIRWDWTLRKMTIKWIENDLSRHWHLKEMISDNWFVTPDSDKWIVSKLRIEERFQLDKSIDKE